MVSIESRINVARQELDESLDSGSFLHNIVVTNNAELDTFEFYCLARDRRWANVGIHRAILTGDFGDFAATVSKAIAIIHDQFPPVVDPDVTTSLIAEPVQTTPVNDDLAAAFHAGTTPDSAALYLPPSPAGAADPFFSTGVEQRVSTDSIPTQAAAVPAARSAASAPSSQEPNLLPKKSLLDRVIGARTSESEGTPDE